MLSPVAYARDCNKLYGEILSHSILVGSQIIERRRKAEVLWHQKYPHIPFEHCDPTTHIIPSDYVTGLSYDLEEAVSRQKLFYYQVSLPHYIDRKFLESSITRYKKFLFLRKISPTAL